jgi:hypothetical protein
MKDNTPNSEKTSCFLDGLLGTTEKLDQLLCVGICSVTAKETTSSMPIKQTGSTQPKKLAKKNQKLP